MRPMGVRARSRPLAALAVTTALLVSLAAGGTASGAAGGRTYTLNTDFDEGLLVGVNHDAPNPDQLQLNNSSSTFPFIWVANSYEGTISKLDTRTGAELGRYRTAPNGYGSNPSRTTVDLDGNVWVGNRDGNTITKVGLAEAGNCIDRNGNGIIETSTGKTDVKPWVTPGAPADECILMNVAFPSGKGTHVRMVAIDAKNNVYAGSSENTGGWFHYIDGKTGAVLRSRQVNAGFLYGGVVDPEGRLWISGHDSNKVFRYDPVADTVLDIPVGHLAYGIGIDKFGHIWSSGWTSHNITKIDRATGTVLAHYPVGGSCWNLGARGVAVQDNGDVWVANSCTNTVVHLRNDGSWVGAVGVGWQPTGVAIDADGKIWVTNLDSDNVTRVDPITNATTFFQVGDGPYNYSDMTGHIIRNITTTTGTWTATYDSGAAGTAWGTLSWHGTTPPNTSITGRVRAADTVSGLGARTYAAVGNGVGFTGVTGRYIQIEMTLQTSVAGTTPVLKDVTIDPEVPCDPDPTLTWKAPLNPGTPYNLPVGDGLPIRFSWGVCGGFIHDESVIIQVQDPTTPDYPVTVWVYEGDIVIDDAAGEYQQDFYPSWYGVEPGTDLEVQVFLGDRFAGEAWVHTTP